MQSLKDTFYLMLRDRVAKNNAERTVIVRGVSRPGVLVVENELPGASAAGIPVLEAFCLRWKGLTVDRRSGMALTGMQCEMTYATDGTAGSAGTDRGRALTEMDEELALALEASPCFVPKVDTEAGQTTSLTGDGTNIFWTGLAFGPALMQNERMVRTATVEVYCYGD